MRGREGDREGGGQGRESEGWRMGARVPRRPGRLAARPVGAIRPVGAEPRSGLLCFEGPGAGRGAHRDASPHLRCRAAARGLQRRSSGSRGAPPRPPRRPTIGAARPAGKPSVRCGPALAGLESDSGPRPHEPRLPNHARPDARSGGDTRGDGGAGGDCIGCIGCGCWDAGGGGGGGLRRRRRRRRRLVPPHQHRFARRRCRRRP
jgi:hypothetical protein